MAGKIETTFALDAGEVPPSSTHSAPQASSAGDGSFLRRMSDTSDAESADEAHERAIRSCGLDVEHHMRKRDDAMREYARTGCFDARGEADRQLALARDAAEMQRVLIHRRSPEKKAQMEAESRARLLREPGADLGVTHSGGLDRAFMQRGRG